MDGRKMLNLSLQSLLFRGFLRFLFLFTLLYIFRVENCILFNKFLSQKRQPIWQEEKNGDYVGKKGIIFLYVKSLTDIIHWISLFIE